MTQHVDPKSLFGFSGRPDNNRPVPARECPLSCVDGSLVINADGMVSKASLEQQRIAMAAGAAGADGFREQG